MNYLYYLLYCLCSIALLRAIREGYLSLKDLYDEPENFATELKNLDKGK